MPCGRPCAPPRSLRESDAGAFFSPGSLLIMQTFAHFYAQYCVILRKNDRLSQIEYR